MSDPSHQIKDAWIPWATKRDEDGMPDDELAAFRAGYAAGLDEAVEVYRHSGAIWLPEVVQAVQDRASQERTEARTSSDSGTDRA